MTSKMKRPGPKQRTGAFGEEITVRFVTERGDEILDRNWRIREGEIDVISLSKDGVFHMTCNVRTLCARGQIYE